MAEFTFKPTVKAGILSSEVTLNVALVSEIRTSVEDPINTCDVFMNNGHVYNIYNNDAEKLKHLLSKI